MKGPLILAIICLLVINLHYTQGLDCFVCSSVQDENGYNEFCNAEKIQPDAKVCAEEPITSKPTEATTSVNTETPPTTAATELPPTTVEATISTEPSSTVTEDTSTTTEPTTTPETTADTTSEATTSESTSESPEFREKREIKAMVPVCMRVTGKAKVGDETVDAVRRSCVRSYDDTKLGCSKDTVDGFEGEAETCYCKENGCNGHPKNDNDNNHGFRIGNSNLALQMVGVAAIIRLIFPRV